MTMFKTRYSPGGNGGAVRLECRRCGAFVDMVVTEIDGPPLCDECRLPPPEPICGELMSIGCRRCGKEVRIGVIELSRAHRPPLCKECEKNEIHANPAVPVSLRNGPN